MCSKPRLCIPVFKLLSFLSLPSRRHVLSFHTKATVGYHVHLCSKTPFIFGDEETIMSHLTKVTKLIYSFSLFLFWEVILVCLLNKECPFNFLICGCNFPAEGSTTAEVIYSKGNIAWYFPSSLLFIMSKYTGRINIWIALQRTILSTLFCHLLLQDSCTLMCTFLL